MSESGSWNGKRACELRGNRKWNGPGVGAEIEPKAGKEVQAEVGVGINDELEVEVEIEVEVNKKQKYK